MIALLVVQAIQTAQIYDQKSTAFAKRFGTSMERIALRHEKAEDIRRYMHVMDKDFSVKYKDILKEEFQNMLSSQESISIKDTTIFEDGEMEDYLIIRGKTYDSISGLTAQQQVLARDVRKFRDLFRNGQENIDQDSMNLAIKLDQRVIQQIFKKARFVNELMVEAFRNNIYQDASQRIDVVFLDSILKTELSETNLPEVYRFTVTDEYGSPIAFNNAPETYTTELDTVKSHSAQLFPSNSLDNDLYLYLSFPKEKSFLYKEMWGQLAVNFGLVVLIILALFIMFKTILTQKKLSEMKNDFISNMTHEFKTPISTISLACEAMNDADMSGGQNELSATYVKMINDENKRLSLLVERILQSATLDRGELKLQNETIDLSKIVTDVVDHARFRTAGEGGVVDLDIDHVSILIEGDRMHTANVVSNLVDNAIKYSGGQPKVRVSLKRDNKRVILSVSDQGIGIKKEHLCLLYTSDAADD